MKYYFSSGNNGFYNSTVHTNIPQGAIEITESEYIAALNSANNYGVHLIAGTEGKLELSGHPVALPPDTVPMYQARIALHQAGLLATVQAGIGQMSEEAQIKWEFAPTVRREDALTAAMATALNLSEEQLDGLFTTAAGIV